MELYWKETGLLSSKTEKTRSAVAKNDARNEFDKDYDRIVFSSPFRRLQDKAQVFPLEKSDFVRTRLTHSMEVSAIARSIGVSVENRLVEDKLDIDDKGKIPMILASAGLAHDLGNPPFGHFGEETIKRVFDKQFNQEQRREYTIKLSELQKADLCNFDGNCQTIRLLTRLQCLDDEWGFHLTFATLATLMKYPMNSLNGNRKNGNVAYKKFGYFNSEREVSEKVIEAVGTTKVAGEAVRHPLSFLLEAADDIAYSAADLEDGFKKKVISFEDIETVFKDQKEVLDQLKKYKNENKYGGKEKAIQQFRIYLQGKMISAVTNKFIDEQDKLLSGEYEKEILMESDAKPIREALKNLAKIILANEEIHKTELAGESILSFLLQFFIDALTTDKVIDSIIDKVRISKTSVDQTIMDQPSLNKIFMNALDQRSQRVYNLISNDYRNVYEKTVYKLADDKELRANVLYNTYILITDFISCMTDNYSLELYRRLKGISII